MINEFDQVVKILTSKSEDLQYLVSITGRDRFRFFNGADLRGLDLSKQDLTGMNFDNADLRFSELRGTIYDAGCFNNSILDSNQRWLQDDFEFNSTEVIQFPNEQLQAFAKIRPFIIDSIINALGVTFETFALRVDLSIASLRKSRQSKVIAIETAQSLLSGCRMLLEESEHVVHRQYKILIEQPCVSLLVGGNNSPFRPLTHAGLAHLLLLRRLRMRDDFLKYRGKVPEYLTHRDTAEYLRYFEDLVDREDLYVDSEDY